MSVTILSGLPGSGKSKLARDMTTHADGVTRTGIVISADDYFMRTGSYVFDPRDIGLAHADCFRRFLDALAALASGKVSPFDVIVDNTNLSLWEISPYVLAATAYGGDYPTVVTVVCDPALAFARQTHGVPRASFDRMVETLESRQLPPFWPRSTHIGESYKTAV